MPQIIVKIRPHARKKGVFHWSASVDGIEIDAGFAVGEESAKDQGIFAVEDWKEARDLPLFCEPYPNIIIQQE